MAKKGLDKESVVIHRKILAEIAYTAVKDIKGVSLVSEGFLKKVFLKNVFDGIAVKVINDSVSLEIKVYIKYGLNIPLIAKEIQDVVKKAFTKTVEVELTNININVAGVKRG